MATGGKSDDATSFWWRNAGLYAGLLAPLAGIYGAVAGRRMVQRSAPKVALPVLCIGNFTVGGAGKTPTCIAFAQGAKALGLKPGIVSRGYGGRFEGVHLVDAGVDTASLVGDEPLLLAQHAQVAVSPDRHAAALLLQQQGCDFIIMDDGFQSARLHYDYALVVTDAIRGIGNGRIIPAGPVRAPLTIQMEKASGLLRITPQGWAGVDAAAEIIRLAAQTNKPYFDAKLISVAHEPVAGKRFLAFAGIGNPQKFYDSVQSLGGIVEQSRSFADHYSYKPGDIRQLLQQAQQAGLQLATTAKDYVRLQAIASHIEGDWLQNIAVFDVMLDFGSGKVVERIIRTTQQAFQERRLM